MTGFTDEQIDHLAQTLFAGYYGDETLPIPLDGRSAWDEQSIQAKGRWRRAARAIGRHLDTGQPVNKAPHHMSEEETDLVALCDEYEVYRDKTGKLADAVTDFAAFRIAEHFALIRRAIHRAA